MRFIDQTITLPLWLFALVAVFAVVMVIDRVLMPSVYWYLRRRLNRVIEEINTRLDIEISPFQQTRRQALIDQLVFDEKVIATIRDYAKEHNMPFEAVRARAFKYAREIVPAFNVYIYFRVGYWLARKISRLIYRIRVGFFDDDQLKHIPQDSSVVFVMNHRSNMDYLLVSFLVAEKTALSYAVGEWARIWPLETLIKAMGAFFVRRKSGNPLYRKVLERYVNLATRAGVCQAVFLEGGLTKDGVMREPRLGFLDYMLRDYHPDIDRDVVFVPVGINYDRVIEDRSLMHAQLLDATKRSRWFVIKTTLKFIVKTTFMHRKKRWRRFGYASVNFARPVSAREYCNKLNIDFSKKDKEERFLCVKDLASSLVKKVEEVIPVLPVSLISEIVLRNKGEWKSELELKSDAIKRISELESQGAPINISASACERVLSSALNMLEGRNFIEVKDNLYRANQESVSVLSYYANSIKHWSEKDLAKPG